MQVEKTVFISYRRTNVFTAHAVNQHLTIHGYDVFLDYENIDAGSFEQIILNQIAARAHFVIVLTPSALERCAEPGDWLRREIEYAIDLKRNIVPLMFEDFDFGVMSKYLTGKLAMLSKYNGLPVYSAYFKEAMERLHTRFLNLPLEMILHPTPPADLPVVRQQQVAAAQQTSVSEKQLTAEEYFERAFNYPETDSESKISDYTEAIHLNPQYTFAYNNRGAVRFSIGDKEGAIADYTEAIRINPQYATAYANRANVRYGSGDLRGAIADYTEAIRINPQFFQAYGNRGIAWEKLGDLDNAIADYTSVLRINPGDAIAYCNLAGGRYTKGDLDGALADYSEAIRLNPQFADAYNRRGNVYRTKGDLDGALADYSEAIRLNPQFANAYISRGVVYADKVDLDNAINDYKKAIQLNPNINIAYSNIGEIYFEKQEYGKAIRDFQTANELDPAAPHALAGLAISHHAVGNLNKAKAYWRLLGGLDHRYKDVDWTGKELNWHLPLIEEARKLAAQL